MTASSESEFCVIVASHVVHVVRGGKGQLGLGRFGPLSTTKPARIESLETVSPPPQKKRKKQLESIC
jgi:hypothetical protein